MLKSRGERKEKYKNRNKNNGKKQPFRFRKNRCVAHRIIRNYIKSNINWNKGDYNALEDMTVPSYYKKTKDWFDVTAPMPSVFKFKNF